jgi:hypothetical protein|tara:strand:+ start:957 stop:1331 length:375 start_codon:yes stop_codon:yes gene_type:complete
MSIQSDKTNTKKDAMLKALEKTLGIVTTACTLAKVSRSQHYHWMNHDPEYKRSVTDLENIALDFAESHLHELIKDGSPAATIFFLKTKGKRRGYIETTAIEVTEKKPLTWMDEVVTRKEIRESK